MARKCVLVDDIEHCVECGRERVAMHHIFFGTDNRKLSDEDGYVIPMCHYHHNGSNAAIHFNRELDLKWKRIAQLHYEHDHSRKEFIDRYGRSYL